MVGEFVFVYAGYNKKGARIVDNGEGEIRTRGTVARTQHFQCCTFGHSVTSPDEAGILRGVGRYLQSAKRFLPQIGVVGARLVKSLASRGACIQIRIDDARGVSSYRVSVRISVTIA